MAGRGSRADGMGEGSSCHLQVPSLHLTTGEEAASPAHVSQPLDAEALLAGTA